ncbi:MULTISPECIES: toll/interleukin-1 receptor domain-containing protein [unclassified Pseudoalteromonas]|uniref:toll/interleukin-1 receptor domain-containing protein n=1 Tax=unclassified Pseudoalteromonas TaxID=194690 RepID=UPI0023585947|nr:MULTISPECIES: toll/interleukin-1 receptor domain-containing protein [unclassified Pseudoalteromonas]MDC9563304.1 toll/interleukin-1 receptor domain-containing protein [Pseudoalteromonas sp. GAB2316C]MDC9567681.1 toll/interleukin-1 receptor domain-containing protein [Pseudoalteromonas sp. GABNB9D]MDC9571958.1 toll/interleukin-1 receptor domain-containing protein [Pseudoalteromonas sp. GABNS16A]MDC9576369.1 toll/interleukin-1 receptor domain-containing protein [Pseudoalteromonas sp. GABNS16E]
MAVKVFISYAHKDEQFKDSLVEHMSGLVRANVVSEWNDRKIVPGQDWSDEISENLASSEIILFLISSSFMNSDYCMGVEVQKALSMHKEGRAQLIPIIIRAVDWTDSELSKIQGLPKDAVPIASWGNEDEAWVNVIGGVKKHIQEFKPKLHPIKKAKAQGVQLTDKASSWLSDTEIVLTHRKVNQVSLDDIYVVPDVELDSSNDLVDIKPAKHLLQNLGHHIISGEEQQGKTSLLKYLYKELLKLSFLPVYLDALNIKKASAEQEISRALTEQYENLTFESFNKNEKAVVLIDNIDEIGLNKKFKSKFLEEINQTTDNTFITCHSSYTFIYGDIPALDEHDRIELMGLGNKKREELVQKWISLGVEESIEEGELYAKCDELKARLNIVIKKNIVPPKPIYVLMLLQMFEANAQLNLDLTSYGHCYQQLIYQSFDKANIDKQDFDKYLNVLTELAWEIFQHGSDLNIHQIEEFFKNYSEVYLHVDKEKVLRKLVGHSILSSNGINVGFKYPYIYYFFVGKKIAESYRDSEETQAKIQDLLERLHREDFANILIFITHHTKDSWVLNEIKSILTSLFDDQKEATLDKEQLSFMSEFMKAIPELIIEQREIQNERDKQNERLDQMERNSDDKDEVELDILANINKTFKGMEIAGQIIRNRHATLTRDAMEELAKTGANAGLRFLEYFIKISDTAKKEIVKLISTHLSEHPNLTNREIEKQAENAYLHLTYGVINGITRKIASSVGSKEALEVYREMEKNVGTPAFHLIRQAIELQFNKSINIEHISSCVKQLKDNQVCLRILKEMVIQHIYLFPVDYKEKQQLSHLLGISVQGQRWMDTKKTGKG